MASHRDIKAPAWPLATRLRALPPAALAGAAQLVAVALVSLPWALHLLPPGTVPSLFQWAFIEGLVAAALGYRFGLAPWWLPIQAGFVPALAAMRALDIPPFWFLAAFVLLALFYRSTFRTQVPLYLSGRGVRKELRQLLPEHPGFSFIDLGCGLGGVVTHLARQRPDGRYHGIEAAPLPCLISWLRARAVPSACRISWGDFWGLDLACYDVVYAYLSPVPMADLWRKARTEMRPGSLFVSNAFVVPDVPPTRVMHPNGPRGAALYVWRL